MRNVWIAHTAIVTTATTASDARTKRISGATEPPRIGEVSPRIRPAHDTGYRPFGLPSPVDRRRRIRVARGTSRGSGTSAG